MEPIVELMKNPVVSGFVGSLIIGGCVYAYNQWENRPKDKCPVCGTRQTAKPVYEKDASGGVHLAGTIYPECQHATRNAARQS